MLQDLNSKKLMVQKLKCRGDLGLGFLKEVVEAGPKLFKSKGIGLNVRGVCDKTGYQKFKVALMFPGIHHAKKK
jgi:hypothetical protein